MPAYHASWKCVLMSHCKGTFYRWGWLKHWEIRAEQDLVGNILVNQLSNSYSFHNFLFFTFFLYPIPARNRFCVPLSPRGRVEGWKAEVCGSLETSWISFPGSFYQLRRLGLEGTGQSCGGERHWEWMCFVSWRTEMDGLGWSESWFCFRKV